MTYADLKSWLQQTMGLDPTTVGPLALERAVQSRMAACELSDVDSYVKVLRDSTVEQQHFIERLVVRETSFFRDRQAFSALVTVFEAAWLHAHAGMLRLLCLPCATGEEAYSMAIALLDAGFPAARLRIDAVDISRSALDAAARGVYGSHSFRGADLAYRARHFEQVGGKWEVSQAVRAPVRFEWGNVLALGTEHAAAQYHAIFCRNLLIYFDEATQARTVRGLIEMLRDDGLLFVGPSEAGLLLSMGLDSAKFPMAFAFHKPGPAAVQGAPSRGLGSGAVAVVRVPPRSSVVAGSLGVINQPTRAGRTDVTAPTSLEVLPDLDTAEALADKGFFEDAAAVCTAHVQAHGASARSFYLLGLVQGARGDSSRAEALFRKALYLEPEHAQALAHLALLLDGKGDVAGARRLRQRSRRGQGRAS